MTLKAKLRKRSRKHFEFIALFGLEDYTEVTVYTKGGGVFSGEIEWRTDDFGLTSLLGDDPGCIWIAPTDEQMGWSKERDMETTEDEEAYDEMLERRQMTLIPVSEIVAITANGGTWGSALRRVAKILEDNQEAPA